MLKSRLGVFVNVYRKRFHKSVLNPGFQQVIYPHVNNFVELTAITLNFKELKRI